MLTDTVSQQQSEQQLPSLFDFGLVVQAVRRSQLETGELLEETERLPVLEGLRKYAKEHVLLVGQLGSGKSAAIARLLLEEAQASFHLISALERNEEPSLSLKGAGDVLPRIPVLVRLRQYKTSVLDLIRSFLQRHGLQLDRATVERLLIERRFLLLVDGVNELPTEAARRDLEAFRQNYAATPTVFTTRDLGVVGDLGIDNKLEMQPLTQVQIQQFVHAYLPTQGDQMLRQWSDRLWELGQLPLLLWMLCELFRATGNLPPNLGLAFRYFTQIYDRKIKEDIPADESYYWWPQLLQQLASVMMQGETLTQLRVAISRQEAEAVLTTFLQGKVDYPPSRAKVWLEDLLEHHLIQASIGERVEFRHQLLQEYYAAEWLLQQLPHISDDRLKREYLNYLKWTKSLAMVMALVEQDQAVRVVQLALEVDLKLGVRLAREVKPEIQMQTVGLVNAKIPQLKDELLRVTRSDSGIPPAFQVLESVPQALNKTDAEAEISALLQNLSNRSPFTRWRSAQALGNIGTKAATPDLLQALADENHSVRAFAAQALGKIGAEAATPALLQALSDKDYWVRGSAAQALGKIGAEAATPALLQLWSDKDNFVHRSVAQALGRIGTEAAIPALLQASSDKDNSVRRSAAQGLGRIGTEVSMNALLQALADEDNSVRAIAAQALGKTGDAQLLPRLSELLLTAASNHHDVISVILAIQQRCEFYNYEL